MYAQHPTYHHVEYCCALGMECLTINGHNISKWGTQFQRIRSCFKRSVSWQIVFLDVATELLTYLSSENFVCQSNRVGQFKSSFKCLFRGYKVVSSQCDQFVNKKSQGVVPWGKCQLPCKAHHPELLHGLAELQRAQWICRSWDLCRVQSRLDKCQQDWPPWEANFAIEFCHRFPSHTEDLGHPVRTAKVHQVGHKSC